MFHRSTRFNLKVFFFVEGLSDRVVVWVDIIATSTHPNHAETPRFFFSSAFEVGLVASGGLDRKRNDYNVDL